MRVVSQVRFQNENLPGSEPGIKANEDQKAVFKELILDRLLIEAGKNIPVDFVKQEAQPNNQTLLTGELIIIGAKI